MTTKIYKPLWVPPDFEKELATAIAAGIHQATAPLALRLASLETELALVKSELAARPGMQDKGVHSPNNSYRPGDVVSYGGSAWVCNAHHVSGPQIDHAKFRLFVKKGRDGRDRTNDA